MKILNQTQNTILASNASVADTLLSRMVGLLNRKSLASHEALMITKCKSIHMLFMRFSIDAVFVDKHNTVVGLCEGIKPYQFSPIFINSIFVIELAQGSITRSKTSLGDQIVLEKHF